MATVTSAVATSPTNVRATFSEPVAVTASLTSTRNYGIGFTPNMGGGPGDIEPTISAVTAQVGGAPTYVDITVDAQTNGVSYRLFVTGVTGVTNAEEDFIGMSALVATLSGFYLTQATTVEISVDGKALEDVTKDWDPLEALFVSDEEITLTLPANPSATIADFRVTVGGRVTIMLSAYPYP